MAKSTKIGFDTHLFRVATKIGYPSPLRDLRPLALTRFHHGPVYIGEDDFP
jgi:hypothetical protein